MLVMVPFVFLVNGITKGDWFAAFVFAVSVAVGLTPEMLPMIVTSNLAKGAVKMARKKTIVKNLNAIMAVGIVIPFTALGAKIGLAPLPLAYFPWLIATLLCYCFLTQVIKHWYIRKFAHWL